MLEALEGMVVTALNAVVMVIEDLEETDMDLQLVQNIDLLWKIYLVVAAGKT